jgi:hypothetical protein
MSRFPGKRKVLARYGRVNDQVKAVVDDKAGAVLVYYRDSHGIPRKRRFPLTKDGRAESVEWASTYHEERDRLERERTSAAARPRATLRDLWTAYRNANWDDLRPKTRIAYEGRWAKWERFVGRDTLADDVTLQHADDYRAAARKVDTALNQIRQVLNVARIVFAWGSTRKLITVNELALYRWKQPKDAVVNEPAEYSEAEWEQLLAVASPQKGTTWRIHVALMLAGRQGPRANAARHLKVEDIVDGEIRWPAEFQKNGKALVQPMTDDAIAAVMTALYWRQECGYAGPWLLFAGGGNKRLAPARVNAVLGASSRYRRRSDRSYRRDRTADQDTPYTYAAMHRALLKAEERAGVEHKRYRAFHGFRRMAAGNAAEKTRDARLGMQWIGDRDMKQAPKYLKQRDDQMDRVAEATESKK